MTPKILIAKYLENIKWIEDNNLSDRTVIYNKSPNVSRLSHLNIIIRPNNPAFGREAETYIHHIITNYDNLDDYTIFTQGNPFDHQSEFIELISFLDKNNGYKNFQPLTYEWNIKGLGVPASYLIDYDKTLWVDKYKIYMETIDEDLCSFFYKDYGFLNILNRFKEHYKLTHQDKALRYVYDRLKINKPYCGMAKFNFGAIFGVKKDNILQHPIDFYKNLYTFICEYHTNAFILERLWYTILS